MADYRILITGSRNWADWPRIGFQLGLAIGQSGHSEDEVVIVHGACPNGADEIVNVLATAYGYRVERHPADWQAHGKSAGFRRNAEMVALGADICLVFIRNSSRGASHCAEAAERAGIPTRRFSG